MIIDIKLFGRNFVFDQLLGSPQEKLVVLRIVRLIFKFGKHLLFTFFKALKKQRVECSALTVKYHFHCFFMRVCFLVASVAGKRVIYIGKGGYLC